jgi:hypothetical protein
MIQLHLLFFRSEGVVKEMRYTAMMTHGALVLSVFVAAMKSWQCKDYVVKHTTCIR